MSTPAIPFQSLWGQTENTTAPPPNFLDAYQRTYGGADYPDTFYNAQREKFFDERVAPWHLQQGNAIGPAREEFMKQTERAGKSEHPILSQIGHTAAASLAAPLEAFGETGRHAAEDLQRSAQGATQEAVRQGVNPQWPIIGNPYTALGEMAGQAPYWALGMGAEGAIAEGMGVAEGTLARRAMKTATGAIIQGAYDAAKAPQGKTLEGGVQGAASGGALVGTMEFAGPLTRAFKGLISPEEGAAVEKVAKGIATDKDTALAGRAVTSLDNIDQTIEEWQKGKTFGTNKAGVPKQGTDVSGADGKVTINLTGADGKSYPLQKLDAAGVESVLPNLVEHVKAGGSIEALEGDPVAIQKLLKSIEEKASEAFELDTSYNGHPSKITKNDTIISGPRQMPEYGDLWKSQEPTHEMQATEYEDLWKAHDQHAAEVEGMSLTPKVSFGDNEVPIKGGGKIKFRAVAPEIPPMDLKPGAQTFPRFHDWADSRSAPEDIWDLPDYKQQRLYERAKDEFEATRPVETPEPSSEPKQRPLYNRVIDGEFTQDDGMLGAAHRLPKDAEPGTNPTIEFSSQLTKEQKPNIIHHEMIHAHIDYLGLANDLPGIVGKNLPEEIFYHPSFKWAQNTYSPFNWPEETFAYTSAAIRTGDAKTLNMFADADGGKDHLLEWYTNSAKDLLKAAAEKEDSLHKRTFERRLNYTIGQATRSLEELRRPFSQTHDLGVDAQANTWKSTDLSTGKTTHFTTRDEMMQSMEPHQEPLNTPELVDISNLPPIPRRAVDLNVHTVARAPITTDPPPSAPIPEGGVLAFSGMIRPFYDWVDSVGRKFGRMDLPAAFETVRDKHLDYDNSVRRVDALEDLAKWPTARRTDAYHYIAADEAGKEFIKTSLRFSPKELATLDKFDSQAQLHMPEFHGYLQKTVPEMRANDWDVATRFPVGINDSMEAQIVRTGRLDPRDEDLGRVAFSYLRGQAFHEHIEPALKAAEKLVEGKNENGDYTFGATRDLMQRQVQYYRGLPDFTQKLVLSATKQVQEGFNSTIDKVNAHLPDSMQIEKLDDAPRNVIQKFILFNYAGALGLRPAVPIKDTLSLFLTTLPIAGGKNIMKGMKRAFEKGGYDIANENGWLVHKSNLHEMIAGGGDAQKGMMEKFATKALTPLQWSENSKRLVAGWAFTEKIGDALENFARDGDKDKFLKDSGFWFLNETRQTARLKEAALATDAGPAERAAFTHKAARDLVDATQWDYSKGANPGIYKYQLGRLFGQYGMWPLNYIEYARKFVTAMPGPHRSEAIKGLTRFVAINGAVLAAGQGVGIDSAQWVFSQPMAYGGSPLFNAVINIPGSADFESYRGAESRRQVIQPIFPGMIPGSNEVKGLWKAISEDSSDAWVHMLGFQPMKKNEAEHGLHNFVP